MKVNYFFLTKNCVLKNNLYFCSPNFKDSYLVMYAIVDIAGQQFKVEKGKKMYVHRLNAEEGAQIEFSKIMLADDNGKVIVGKPYVEGAKITAKVLKHLKGDKVLVFKKKRRNGYQKLNGHRQLFSQIEIQQITL